MYHYVSNPCRTALGESLWRDPQEIREEIALIRDLIQRAQARMLACEEAREELLLSLDGSDAPSAEQIRQLEEVVECCEEVKGMIEELWQRADTLSEELSDTLWWLQGATA